MIGNINSLNHINELIKEKSKKVEKKPSVVKKLFKDDPEPEIHLGYSGGSLPVEEAQSCLEEAKSSDKEKLELEVTSNEADVIMAP
jgi:hypothetical protein